MSWLEDLPGFSVEEAWSDKARVAALAARRLHRHAPALRSMFTPAEEASSRAQRQPTADFDQLYHRAENLQPRFEKMMGDVAKELHAPRLGVGAREAADVVPHRMAAHSVIVAPIKGRKRAEEKLAKYKGDAGRLTDLVRGTVLAPKLGDVPNAMRVVRKHAAAHGFEIVKPESRYHHEPGSDVHTGPLASGYRDASVLVRDRKSGDLAELQLNHNHIYVGKEVGHDGGPSGHSLYEQERVLTEAHGEDMPAPVLRRVKGLQARQRGIYERSHAAGLGVGPEPTL